MPRRPRQEEGQQPHEAETPVSVRQVHSPISMRNTSRSASRSRSTFVSRTVRQHAAPARRSTKVETSPAAGAVPATTAVRSCRCKGFPASKRFVSGSTASRVSTTCAGTASAMRSHTTARDAVQRWGDGGIGCQQAKKKSQHRQCRPPHDGLRQRRTLGRRAEQLPPAESCEKLPGRSIGRRGDLDPLRMDAGLRQLGQHSLQPLAPHEGDPAVVFTPQEGRPVVAHPRGEL